MSEYRFGKLEDEIFRLCKANQPDYRKIEQLLSVGANINATDKYGENILASVYHKERGDSFPAITKIFITLGFDVKNKGLECIHELVYSSYDKNIFTTAKLLLNAGANGNNDKWKSLLESIGTEESFQRCCENNHFCENIYYALYELVEHAYKGKTYTDIMLWDSFIGQKISCVLSYRSKPAKMKIHGENKYAIPYELFICSEHKSLVITGNPNIYVRANPIPAVENDKCIIVEELNSIIGCTVTDVYFEHKEVSPNEDCYRQPNIFVKLDNGAKIHFSTDFGEVAKEKTSIYFELLEGSNLSTIPFVT